MAAAEAGYLRVLYLDETGFESWSPPSYSWSRIGEQKRQEQTRCRKRISLLGVWEPGQSMTYGLSFSSVTSQTYCQLMRWQARQAARHYQRTGVVTVIVQDNASIHTSRAVQAEVAQWRQQGLVLFQLPKYCSEMNRIEGEWHQIKAHHICGQMFEDPYDLAIGVIGALRERATLSGHKVTRFNFKTGRSIRSPLMTT